MKRESERRHGVPLVQRGLSDPPRYADPREFAWEVLRRREDYRATPAVSEWMTGTAAPIELIRPAITAPHWGLRFQGGP